MVKFEALLHEEIEDELEDLGKTEIGTDLHKNKVDTVTKLIDREIELRKIESEKELKREQMYADNEMKTKQAEEEKRDRFVKNVLTGVSIALPLAVNVWGALFTTEFEKEGSYRTIFGRETIKKLFSKK